MRWPDPVPAPRWARSWAWAENAFRRWQDAIIAGSNHGEVSMEPHLGEPFVRAVAAKDAAGLTALLSDDVDFKALTPKRFWEAESAASVVDDVIFGHWFEATDHID